MKSDSYFRPLWLPVLLVVAALAWRVAKLKYGVPEQFSNFSPWMALAFAGTLMIPRNIAWWMWPTLLLGCDLAISTGNVAEMWLVYACYALAALAANFLRSRPSVMTTLGGTVAASLAFYLITNTQAWFMSPVYAKTAAGWLQALTVGNPAYPQTWIFGLNSLLSDAGFALLLVVAYNSEALIRRIKRLPMISAAPLVPAH